jgi:O-antigen/teichoic acid export membrane protein
MKQFTIYMMISSIAVSITMQLDVWMMGVNLDNAQLGIYNASLKFALPLTVVLGAVNTVLWPRVSGVFDKQKIKSLLKKMTIVSIGLFICAVCYSLIMPFLIPFVFGTRYSSGIFIGQLLCFRYCISLLFIPISVIGYSLGMVKHYWWINIVQLVVVVTVNIILLPRIGAVGAAVALICNEVVGAILSSSMVYIRYKKLIGE